MNDYVTIGHDIETNEKITIGDIERRSGLYILGKPGMGKSALLVNLIIQDMENEHGVFFLDPHEDAISDLLHRGDYGQMLVLAHLFNLQDETHSFGVNLLACKDVTSLKARTDTYTRAYNVFYKLWENEWGPWLQVVIQNALWAFIENQEHTLAEVPMFLNPRNTAFRNFILSNIKYNTPAGDFWRYVFFQRREREQQELIDAALTRLTTLLTHPYVRHIVGQRETTINYDFVLSFPVPFIWLFKLSANLPADIKKFIGTILISELLHAVRNRAPDEREQFCIFVDEFQNFAGSEDFKTLITEARKFGIATTIAHQERFGQFSDLPKLLGATAAAVNKVFFQLTVKDAQELAPEFARTPTETETRREAVLVFSPRAIEDIWDKGHPNKYITYIREKYFWVVNLLKSNPQENYFVFDPARVPPGYTKQNQGKLNWSEFNDWDMYRSSADMLRQGIALLNKYYHDWMQHKYDGTKPVTSEQMSLMLKIVERLSGVLGYRPVMTPFLPEAKRELLQYAIKRRDAQLAKDILKRNEDIKRSGELLARQVKDILERQGTEGESLEWQLAKLGREQEEKAELWSRINEPRTSTFDINSIPRNLHQNYIKELQAFAIREGLSSHDAENLVEWEIRPISTLEEERLTELVKIVANMSIDHAAYERNWPRVYREYTAIMAHDLIVEKFGKDHGKLPEVVVMPYLQTVTERIVWQMTELQHFIQWCLCGCAYALKEEPIKVPSGRYDEKLKVERTQADLITEMSQELANVPRFTAYAKVIQEIEGRQTVAKGKLKTLPLPARRGPPVRHGEKMPEVEAHAIENGHRFCKERTEIEKELRERERTLSNIRDEPPPTYY